MSAYHVWNPFLADKDTLQFILTTADSDQINKGTNEFIAGILRDLGIAAKPSKWSLEFARTPYFSDYLDSSDWRDRWQPVWRATVKLAKGGKAPTRNVPYFETDSTDDSWTQKDYHGNRKTARALVIADFKKESDREKAEAAIKKHLKGDASFTRSMVKGKFPQLQVDLGEQKTAFFEKGAKPAEEFGKLAEEHGGSLTYKTLSGGGHAPALKR